MKTASVRDLRNHYTSLLGWIDAGEEIVITKRGKPIARLVPENKRATSQVNWSDSPAVKRKRDSAATLTTKQSSEIIHQAAGSW